MARTVISTDGESRSTDFPPLALKDRGQALWGINTVVERTGLSRATVYRYTTRGILPSRRRVGPDRVACLASEVIAWIESRPKLNGDRDHG